jgi:phosphotransferase system HPr (HPr) family protein
VSKVEMRQSEVVITWAEGLHARPASRVVRSARDFASTIKLKCNGQVANARSILSLLLLCATMGTTIQIEAQGEDEEKAIKAVEQVFTSGE